MKTLAEVLPPDAEIRMFFDGKEIMTPPRRPRGEKPATTIRFLRRQIANMEAEIIAVRLANEDKDKVIAGYDVQLSEAQDEIARQASEIHSDNMELSRLRSRIESSVERLAYLEGYFYAKETAHRPTPTPISAAGAPFPSHQSNTYGRTGAENSGGLSVRRPEAQSQDRQESSSQARSHEGFSDQIRRERARHQTHPMRDQVEHIEITEGPNRESMTLPEGYEWRGPGYGPHPYTIWPT